MKMLLLIQFDYVVVGRNYTGSVCYMPITRLSFAEVMWCQYEDRTLVVVPMNGCNISGIWEQL